MELMEDQRFLHFQSLVFHLLMKAAMSSICLPGGPIQGPNTPRPQHFYQNFVGRTRRCKVAFSGFLYICNEKMFDIEVTREVFQDPHADIVVIRPLKVARP